MLVKISYKEDGVLKNYDFFYFNILCLPFLTPYMLETPTCQVVVYFQIFQLLNLVAYEK